MLVNPEGWEGNFFSSWTRNANQFELYPTFQFAPKKWRGRHEFKIGMDVTHRSYAGSSLSHPIQLLRQDGSLAEEISFTSNGPLNASATDVEEFIQDRWIVNDHLSIDVGGRLTSETVGRAAAFGPRVGFAYSPGRTQKTVFRAGAGLFYDRVSLLEEDFVHNPQRTLSFFDETGQPMGSPIPYLNAFVGNGAGLLASRVRLEPDTSPRSFVSNIEVDRQLWGNAIMRVSYIYSQTRNLFIVNPIPDVFGSAGLLGLFPTGQANYHEFEATLHFQPVHHADLNVSYIWSRARGDLNTVSNIFLPLEQPIIRPNVSGILPSDIPNRVVRRARWLTLPDFLFRRCASLPRFSSALAPPGAREQTQSSCRPLFHQSHEPREFSRRVQQREFAFLWPIHRLSAPRGWLHFEFRRLNARQGLRKEHGEGGGRIWQFRLDSGKHGSSSLLSWERLQRRRLHKAGASPASHRRKQPRRATRPQWV